ncbi:MAG: hypothetical protein H7325_11185 [Pedobacter sp.]|nr:hypothetical protein [Pedobacter sp.]
MKSSIDQYDRAKRRFSTWLVNIARNQCFDQLMMQGDLAR